MAARTRKTTPSPMPDREILNIDGAAAFLGVSVKTFSKVLREGDVPGRKEPLTGEINYRNVFKAIHAKGYKGFLGMEHGLSGGRGVKSPKKIHNCFKAYEWCDSWD